MLSPGMLVDRYELVSPVGEGGMAQVWVARQKGKHGFEKLFAFKCIHTRFADSPAFRTMFLDEARIAAAIEHPNVAQVYDLGEAESMLYLVMEFVDGESLGSLMMAAARRANDWVPVPTGVALRIIADACAGLHAAHRLTDANGNLRGVVHRDVSPQNILVSVRGDVKVIDFGIALAKDRIGSDTAAGSLKGKLHYMAPEQALREPVGPFTDVYAMGATLYRMLAGRPPHDGGNDAATLHMLLSGAPTPPLPDNVPPLVAAIVEHALEREPGDRYQSALAMQTAIEQAIVEEGYVADVGTWVAENLSDAAKERRLQLATRTLNIAPAPEPEPEPPAPPPPPAEAPSFIAELGLPPERPRPNAPAPRAAAGPLVLDRGGPSSGRAPAAAPAPAPAPARAPAPAPVGHEPPSAGPGMLDVRALVARAANPPPPQPYPPAPSSNASIPPAPPSSQRSVAAEPEAAPAREAPRLVGPTTKAAPETAGARGGTWMKLAVFAVVIVLLLAGVLLFLPMIVHDRVIASAREAGIDLTIDRVGIGIGGVALKGVTAKAQRVPGGELRAEEIFATGFSAKEVRVRGAELKLTGHVRDVGPAVLAFYEANRARLSGGGEPRRVTVAGARLAWNGFLGEGSRLDAGEVGTEIESRAVGAEDIRATVARFEIKTKRTTFGPWTASFERNAATSRLRVLFDPPVPDGPSTLVVWGKGLSPRFTVRIPRSPIARLGLRPDELGLPSSPDMELEVKLEVAQSPTMRWEASGRTDVFGVRLKGVKSPVDIKMEGSASGAPGKQLDFERTTVTLGPFLANVTGSVTPTDSGFRLDASWRTVPIACEKLARAEARSMGPIAAAIQELAHSTGAARVTGTAQSSGVLNYDTQTPDEALVTAMIHDACGLSIFGH